MVVFLANGFDYSALPELVQEYIDYLESVKNKSDLTVLNYATDLQLFFRYFKLYKDPSVSKSDLRTADLSRVDIRDMDLSVIGSVELKDAYAFLAYCKTVRQNDAAARARKVVSLKRFYRYLSLDSRYLPENPLRDLESPKIGKTLPKYLTLDQSMDLLQCVDGPFRERDYCILTLFLNCGLRISELVGLNLNDISNECTMRVIGKGNKERTIYLTPACDAALRNYLRVRPADGVLDRDALFISRNRRRISVRAVQNVVDKFLKKAGLDDKGFSAHKLRHTAATLMYQYGHVDVLLLKEMLGHENLSTTEIYTHIDDEQLRQAANANPLASLASPSADQEN